jgi:hypothetical protein
MTRLNWNNAGERIYETGIDRGVLFLDGTGVAWPGLVSVAESPSGGDPRPYYIDGIKYLNLASAEEFEATIEAFSSPFEFREYDGLREVHNGLFAAQQPKKTFGFSYRTRIGNDVEGPDYGYKIHLVYNALAGSTDQTHQSISDSTEVEPRSWAITTLPPILTGRRPTAHFVIDSRSTAPQLLDIVEDILYGSEGVEPRLPPASELVALFQSEGPVVGRNLLLNPTFRTSSGTMEIRRNYALNPRQVSTGYVGAGGTREWLATLPIGNPWPISTAIRVTPTAAWTPIPLATIPSLSIDKRYTVKLFAATQADLGSIWILQNLPANLDIVLSWNGGHYQNGVLTTNRAMATADDGTWHEYRFVVPANTPAFSLGLKEISGGAGGRIVLTSVSVEAVDEILDFFDGSTPTEEDTGWTHSWVGAANASESVKQAPAVFSNFSPYTPNRGGRAGSDRLRLYHPGGSSYTLWGFQSTADVPAEVGKLYGARFEIRQVGEIGPISLFARVDIYQPAYYRTIAVQWFSDLPTDEEWVTFYIPATDTVPEGLNNPTLRLRLQSNPLVTPPGAMLEIRHVRLDEVSAIGENPTDYFDGSTPDADGYHYSWEGPPDNSRSVLNTWY